MLQAETITLLLNTETALKHGSKSGGENLIQGGRSVYDFTVSVAQAYGNNQILKGSKYCIYSGDIDQNDSVDLTDLLLAFNDASNFATGYVASYITGDNYTDISDVLVTYNNSNNFVSVVRP